MSEAAMWADMLRYVDDALTANEAANRALVDVRSEVKALMVAAQEEED